MIPKIIHYCWFGGNPLPSELCEYIEGWEKIYPDFKIIQWNEQNFDVNSVLFTKEAYSVKKYAFVADYVRMWAMYQYGGLYMDTDIKLLKRFDSLFEKYRFFSAMEYHQDNVRILKVKDHLTDDGYKLNPNDVISEICIESSIFAAEAHHPFIYDCLHYYDNRHFILPDGSFYDTIIVPVIMGIEADKYGFRYVDEFQNLKEGMYLMPDEYFTHPSKQTKNTLALHMVKNSWKNKSISQRIYAYIANISFLKKTYDIIGKIPGVSYIYDYLQKVIWLQNRK